MPNPTLIPVDGSELADRIVDPMLPLLRRLGGHVLLVRVVTLEGTAPEQANDLDVASAHLEALAARLSAKGLNVTRRVERGEPADRILAAAVESNAALIAMSTHGRTGAARLLRGSVAERVLRSSPAPVLLCNPHGIESQAEGDVFQKILVPLDGSTFSESILDRVEALALAYGSRVTLLRVHPMVYTSVPSPMLAGALWDAEATRKTLEPARQRLADAGVDVKTKARYGVEPSEILAEAEEADLVAMTTHGRSGLSRWWFGSVAESVIRHCPCPMLVMRIGA